MTEAGSPRPAVADPSGEPESGNGDAAALQLTLLEHELEEFLRENTRLRQSLPGPSYAQLRSLIRRHPRLSQTAIKALNVVAGTGTIHVHERTFALLTLPRDMRDTRRSGLFDPEWYRAHYPGADQSGMDPLRHFVLVGARLGFDPGPRFSTSDYLHQHPDVAAERGNALLHYVRRGMAHGSKIAPSTVESEWLNRTIADRFPNLRPLQVYASTSSDSRVAMVTDSISTGSLFGGVGTALIFATLLSRRLDRALRVITRDEPPDPGNYRAVLEANGISWSGRVDFLFSPREGQEGRPIDVRADDLFVTTSWWTTWATCASRKPEDILYLVQEDERRFYPDGEELLRCAEILMDPRITFVVNSKLLFDDLWGSLAKAEGRRAMWFEPAFPAFLIPPAHNSTGKRKFIFYARPHNLRNLYFRGIEAIAWAIEAGYLDPEEWDFFFIGKDLESVLLPNGVRPVLIQNLGCREYHKVLRRMDLGLSLMASPHPSYPPLDMAAAGAVVVTNTFGPHRRSLSTYSKNIICSDPDLPSLAAAIAQGVALAKDVERRSANHHSSTFATDWNEAFSPLCDRIAATMGAGRD